MKALWTQPPAVQLTKEKVGTRRPGKLYSMTNTRLVQMKYFWSAVEW